MMAGLPDAAFVVVNTDRTKLDTCQVSVKISLGERRTLGLGAGGQPHIGAEAAEEEFARVHGRIADSDLVILGLGRLGGGALTHASDLA
jgi:cell division GTPase FtsZ